MYHLCAPDLRDETLYPLDELRGRHPDLYQRELVKWAGRESVLDLRIPYLDCAWGSTVNLSAIDPRQLITLRRALGLPMSHLLQRRVARIPVERLAGRSAVWFDSTAHWLNSRPGDADALRRPPDTDFSPFDPGRYRELGAVPTMHEHYLQSQLRRSEPALGFVFIPHVLVKGPVSLAGLGLEELSGPDSAD